MRKQEFDVPIFQRLFILFKLKPFEARVQQLMQQKGIDREAAEKKVRKNRAALPTGLKRQQHLHQAVQEHSAHRHRDGVSEHAKCASACSTSSGSACHPARGLGMGAVGAAGKLALLTTNPIAAAGAVAGLGGPSPSARP